MTLTKAGIAKRLHEDMGLNIREGKEFVDMFFDNLREILAEGEQVKLSGFGKFDLRDKETRPGRNPKTKEEIPITARRVVTFKPSQKLKGKVGTYVGATES
uniref:Integration host factor subunit alpha n=1 Tax=Candidatus Kentrum sp. SD TaxID=2126332 RepID=A0A451BNU9_9GAMM|nr:MAG: integration host factor subunit alpha [Candidatus Kentron sp. SD]VFK46210.1 MAG: integration host factor subunit alpha [Candidatus Kentron sp. SD]VFK79966.1 MAG: integration host factor subunit alpha [Candidatus Kentron sp. SD]